MTLIQMRRGTAAQWTAANPTLASGEFGFETDTGLVKIGNGSTAWNARAYTTERINTMNLRQMVVPSGVDDTAAVNAALATFAAAGGGRLLIPRDNWVFTGATGLALTGTSAPIHIEAEPGAVLDMTDSTATTGLTLGGSSTGSSAALGVDAARFADTITCALAVSPGDIIRIQSTAYWEPITSSQKSEMAEVHSSAAGVITLKSALYDNYAAATTTVTLLQMPRVSVEGLTILRNSNHAGLKVEYARNVLLGGLVGAGARERLHYLSNVFGGVVDNCSGTDFWYSGTGTSYGLSVGSSQHIVQRGNNYRGGRHAVSHGGFFPTRDVQVIGGVFDNYHASAAHAFDFHAGCEDVRMVGATVLNGLTTQASNFDAADCTFLGVTVGAVECYAPRDCDYVRLRNVAVRATTGKVGVRWIPRSAVAVAHRVGTFQIDGVIRTVDTCVNITPSSSSDTNSTIGNLSISGDLQATGAGSAAVVTGKSSSASVIVTEATLSGSMRAEDGNTVGISGTGTTLRITGKISTGKLTGYPLKNSTVTDTYLENAVIEGTNAPYRSEFTAAGKVHLKGTTFIGGASVGGVYMVGPTEALLSNVVSVGTTGVMTLPTRAITSLTMLGNARASGTAAPVAGTWKRGDEFTNSVPAVGSPKGWVCTVAGTPGTWVSTGNL